MKKRQHKKQLKKEIGNLKSIDSLVNSVRDNFHRELLLIARHKDKAFFKHLIQHSTLCDELIKLEGDRLNKVANKLTGCAFLLFFIALVNLFLFLIRLVH